jgi:hypothetical protein
MIATQHEPTFTSQEFDIGASTTATGTAEPLSDIGGKWLVHVHNSGDDFIFLRPVPVIVESSDNCYVATFQEANVGASGDDPGEAVLSLVSLLTDIFPFLIENESQLGPDPERQLRVLKQYITRRDAHQGTR